MQIHELNTINRRPGDTDYLAIDTGFDTAKISAPDLLDPKLNRPADAGENGQILRSKGDGNTEWSDVGNPTDEQTEQAINKWLDDHPEATTTVQDGSLDPVKLSDYSKDSLIHNIFIDGLVLDGFTDNTQAIIDALANYTSGIFVIPYGCECDRDSIIASLNNGVVMIDPYYEVVQGSYVAKYFKLLTTKNDPNNDSVVVIEDYNHPCLVLNNRKTDSGYRLASLGFANDYNNNGFLNFSYMISQEVLNNQYKLLFRVMNDISGNYIDAAAMAITEEGTIGFNTNSPGSDFDYVFKASRRRPNRDLTLVQIGNDYEGRAGLTLRLGTGNTKRLDLYTDNADYGVIAYENQKKLCFDPDGLMIYGNEKIRQQTLSGATPTLTGRYAVIKNDTATTMTGLTCSGDIFTLVFANSNTTLQHGSGKFILKGGQNWTPHVYDSITFAKLPALSGTWIEISRNEMGF